MRLTATVLVLVLLAGPMAGCVGNPLDLTPASTDEGSTPPPAINETPNGFSTNSARTLRSDCYGAGISGGVDCFEPSVAVDPDGRIFAAVSVCQGISRSVDDGPTWTFLDLPPLPPTAPPTTTVPGDCTLDVGPQGSLYFSAFYFQERVVDPPGPWVPNHHGIQVARSTDGGQTWEVNTWVAPASRNPAPTAYPDRQWLSFGDGERVYLNFWDPYRVGRSWIAVSEDGGASFGPFRPLPGYFHGAPVTQGNGTIHAPYLDGSGPAYSVHVATSTDGGLSFDRTLVHDASMGSRVWWPDLAQDATGRLHIAWTDGEHVLVSRETDAGGWSTPLVWNGPDPNASAAAPGIEVHDGVIDVVWYRQDGDNQHHLLGRMPLNAWNQSLITTHTIATFNATRPVTHFADMAVTPDGHGVFAWTDPDRGLRLSLEVGSP